MQEKKFEFLAIKSNELLEKQIQSKRSIVSTVGIVISIISVFIGIFFSLIDKSNDLIIVLSFLPILLFCIAFVCFIRTLNIKKLYQGFKETEFDKLINDDILEIYKYEIAVNQKSISKNNSRIKKIEISYKIGMNFILIGVLITFVILVIDFLIK